MCQEADPMAAMVGMVAMSCLSAMRPNGTLVL
jgi:hypothetical protein